MGIMNRPGPKPKAITRQANKKGCDICISHAIDSGGYPQIWRDSKLVGLHRYVFEQTYGPIPPGMCVCHICDNKTCIKPSHLFLGTKSDNAADRDDKKRTARGSHHGQARLNERQALEIFSSTKSQRIIAQEYKIGRSTVQCIKRGRSWGWLTGGFL